MQRSVLAVAMIMGFSGWAPLFVVPPVEDILIQALSLSRIRASILFSGPVLMLSIAALPAGRQADKAGIKKDRRNRGDYYRGRDAGKGIYS
jgi:cyanate permease